MTNFTFRSIFTIWSLDSCLHKCQDFYIYNDLEEELSNLPVKFLVGRRLAPLRSAGLPDRDSASIEGPRITLFGKWIRRASLDKLPNLINVLKGDMHLVGPRPDIAENIRHYPQHHLRRLHVKLGITRLAQVSGRRSYLSCNITTMALNTCASGP